MMSKWRREAQLLESKQFPGQLTALACVGERIALQQGEPAQVKHFGQVGHLTHIFKLLLCFEPLVDHKEATLFS